MNRRRSIPVWKTFWPTGRYLAPLLRGVVFGQALIGQFLRVAVNDLGARKGGQLLYFVHEVACLDGFHVVAKKLNNEAGVGICAGSKLPHLWEVAGGGHWPTRGDIPDENIQIQVLAKSRLADEYDAAQERGEVAKNGDNLPRIGDDNSRADATELKAHRRP